MTADPYGKELLIDLHGCDVSLFNRLDIENYFKLVCDLIDMERCELFWWDDEDVPRELCETEPHLKGTSAVQFIRTSNITIHTLDLMGNVYINVFSCKAFDHDAVVRFTEDWFKGTTVNEQVVMRL